MSRRFAAILLGLTLAVVTTLPVLAHTVSYTTRETGTAECDFDDNVNTQIYAVGHHRHTRVGYSSEFFHQPTNQWTGTLVSWPYFAMTWATANQQGYAYDYGSGGTC